MQTQGAQGIPFALVVGFCLAAWISGAIFGYGLREFRRFIQSRSDRSPAKPRLSLLQTNAGVPERPPRERAQSDPSAWASGAPSAPRRRSRHYRRGGGYYFSEETRGWGDRRWRRRAAWATAASIVLMLAGSVMFAASTYKPSHSAAPGLRH